MILSLIIRKALAGLVMANTVVLINRSFIAKAALKANIRILVVLKIYLGVLVKVLVVLTININAPTAKPKAFVVKTNTPT